MAIVRCNNNHFYDDQRYTSCPHCSGSGGHSDSSSTVALTQPFPQDTGSNVTMAVTQPLQENYAETNVTMPITQPLDRPAEPVRSRPSEDDEVKTVAMYSNKVDVAPVVGWLVSIEGSDYGNSFRLKSGRNFIGRSKQMDICLEGDNTVSRERHAVIVFEPKSITYLVSAGESRELAYLNDGVVLMPQKLNVNDIITVGNTRLMFFPCCNEKLDWSKIIDK